MITFQKSKLGMICAGIFLIIAGIAFATHLISVQTNPADSGLSGIWFFLCGIPWSFMLPTSLTYSKIWRYIAYPVMWGMVIWNAFLLYCIFGGIRLQKNKPPKKEKEKAE